MLRPGPACRSGQGQVDVHIVGRRGEAQLGAVGCQLGVVIHVEGRAQVAAVVWVHRWGRGTHHADWPLVAAGGRSGGGCSCAAAVGGHPSCRDTAKQHQQLQCSTTHRSDMLMARPR